MPGYSSYRVAELRDLCDQRSVDHNGMRKRDMVDALKYDDNCYMRGRTDDRH